MSAGQVYALFETPIAAQRAVNGLRAAGVAEREIMVISSEPFEEYEFSHRDKANWLFPIASGGGVLGLSLGYWLTSMTEKAWPLNTGGMPIVAMWPNLIVIFELTMLGGILATVIALFITAVLPRRRPDLYDTAVSDGYILVGIDQPPPASVDAIKGALTSAGGTLNKT
jgi:hypothetical protein